MKISEVLNYFPKEPFQKAKKTFKDLSQIARPILELTSAIIIMDYYNRSSFEQIKNSNSYKDILKSITLVCFAICELTKD